MPAARYRDSDVEVLTLPPVQVAVLEHQGDKAALEQALSHFIAWRKAEGLHPRQHPTYTVLYPPVPKPQAAPQDPVLPQANTVEDLLTDGEALVVEQTESATAVQNSGERIDLCVTIYGHLPENDLGLIAKVISGGRYAVMRVKGGEPEVREALDFLCGPWLERAGEILRDAPVVLHRIGVGADDPSQADLLDVQLPLE
jgi:AraC family transcriptional regulator